MNSIITIWELWAKNDDGDYDWHHNHISDGYDVAVTKPVGKFPSQQGWSRGTWRSFPATLDDHYIVHRDPII